MYAIHIAQKRLYSIQIKLREFGSVLEESNLKTVEIPFRAEPSQRRVMINGTNVSTYNLPEISVKPALSCVYLNGVLQVYSVDYIIDNAVFTWLSTMNINGDTLIIDYI